jgi:uncharacterized protein YbaP (TraB family)
MKLCFLLVFSFFFIFGAQCQIEKKALLWEIQTKDGKTCAYLFGTIHAMDEKLFLFPKKLEKAFGKCDALCMEIANLYSGQLTFDQLVMKDKSLKDIFTKEQLDTIYTWAEQSLFMKPKQFDENFGSAKPFLLMQFVMQKTLPENPKSYELTFESLAQKNKKEILGLETIDFQLSIFDKMPLDKQSEMVMQTIRDESKGIQMFEEMERLYLNQDLDSLYNFIKQEATLENRDLLENRNINWIPKMERMMQEKVVFFAVGAAHLAGPEGVIELLLKKGYQLIPIKI